MGLFNNSGETKEEKKARKQAEAEAKQAEKDLAALRKFGMENLKNPNDIESVKSILNELSGTGLTELGISLGAGSDRDIQKNIMNYQRAVLEQNFIISSRSGSNQKGHKSNQIYYYGCEPKESH